ncbi:MAG TPA: AAA family ATPase [Aurantimonas coralicida]|nr:AAA family ATPase [Aurantimonas coralicida]
MIKRLGKSKTSEPLPDDLDMELEEMATELLGDKPEKGARPGDTSAVSTPQSASGGRGRPVVAAQRALAGLSPSSDALAARLVRPLWGLREKVNDGGQLLIVLRTRSVDWNAAAEAAAKALLYAAAILREVPFRISSESIDPGARRKTGFETIAEALQADHLIIAVPVGGDLPAPAASLVDLEIDLTAPLTTAEIARTIRRIHRTGSVQRPAPSGCPCPPPEVDLSALNPLEIDVVIRKAATPAAAFTALEKIAALRGDTSGATRPPPSLEDLQGYGDSKTWGLDLARDLGAYRAGALAWADVDAGALLVGPPGTGKTLFASALAKSAGVTFFPTSYAQWQASKDGHLGSVVQAIRKVFSEANAAAPALIFIDELDTLPARGGGERHADWWAAITTCLLECMDGTSRREGVVVIAACNHDRNLDPAIVRSGRLDRRFWIGLPDEKELEAILCHHLPGIDAAAIEPVAVSLAGFTSGADAARIARDARRLARQAGRAVISEDLFAVALPPDDRPPEIQRRIAVHEAGHTVMQMLRGRIPRSVSIIGIGTLGGATITEGVIEESRAVDLDARIAVLLGGRAAEEIILGSVSGGALSDLAEASRLAYEMSGRLGLGDHLSVGGDSAGDSVDRAGIESQLRRIYGMALLRMVERKNDLVDLADLLLDRRVLGRQALTRFARERGLIQEDTPGAPGRMAG